MNPVCFRRTIVKVLLADLAGARGAARFGAVIEDGHAESRTASDCGGPGRDRLAAGVAMTTRVPRRRTVRPVPAEAEPAGGLVQAIARVRLAPYLSRQVFEAHLRTIPAVRSAVHVIGDVDYELRLACRDLGDLRS